MEGSSFKLVSQPHQQPTHGCVLSRRHVGMTQLGRSSLLQPELNILHGPLQEPEACTPHWRGVQQLLGRQCVAVERRNLCRSRQHYARHQLVTGIHEQQA